MVILGSDRQEGCQERIRRLKGRGKREEGARCAGRSRTVWEKAEVLPALFLSRGICFHDSQTAFLLIPSS
jgi:hypothetical protein